MNRNSFLAGLTLCTLGAFPAQAATLQLDIPVSRDGAVSAGTTVSNDAFGTLFSTTSDLTDIDISFQLRCFSGCGGEIVLVSGTPGPDIPFRAFEGREFYDFDASGTQTISAFSGFDLVADQVYALVVTVTKGSAIWFQTNPGSYTENEITDGVDFYTDALNLQASYRSAFEFDDPNDANFNIQISGTVKDGPLQPNVVPLPASSWLLGLTIVGAGWASRRVRTSKPKT